MKINFAKMHGLGNDFVIINKDDLPINLDLQTFVINITNRRTGIGCDQFILYRKHPNYYEMIIYNYDGSKALGCGNGSRCLAWLMHTYYGDDKLTLSIDNRELICEILSPLVININMGNVSFYESWMGSQDEIWTLAKHYKLEPKEVICADIGNQHIIIFKTLNNLDKELLGRNLQQHTLFPNGINVNFAEIRQNKIYLSVWERGVGFTMACASGACATFAAAERLGFVRDKCEIIFELGSLFISKNNDDDVLMRGPAALICQGQYDYE
jgi:diaminopimelate epimerase